MRISFWGSLLTLGALLPALPLVSALPSSLSLLSKPHPVVVWHGLGDSAYSPSMKSFKSSLEEAFPGIYVHLVTLADDAASDQRAGFFGRVDEQVQMVCKQLSEVRELQGGFDAVGFSQGGQFLRAYVERCNSPPVRNLITFGSQHQGIADFPGCAPSDLLCRLAASALRGGIYTDYAQSHLVSAQYFRDPRTAETYASFLDRNAFLADINNERPLKNKSYKKRMQELDAFVMVMFSKDVTVVPRQSSWFASYPPPPPESLSAGVGAGAAARTNDSALLISQGADDPEPLPLRQSPIYTQDWIGLKSLDKRGALIFELCHGTHMQIDSACQVKIFGRYIGQPSTSLSFPLPLPLPTRTALRHTWARLIYTLTGLHAAALSESAHVALGLMFASAAVWIAAEARAGAVVFGRWRAGAGGRRGRIELK